MSRLIAALKRKFPTPQDAVKALGLDAALLDDDDALIAMDGASSRELRDRLRGMSRDERRRVYDMLRQHQAGLARKYDEAADRHRYRTSDRRREREVADRFRGRRRRAEDDPPDFPGHPHPGGSITAPAAFDSAHDRGFFDRFPETKHITVLGR